MSAESKKLDAICAGWTISEVAPLQTEGLDVPAFTLVLEKGGERKVHIGRGETGFAITEATVETSPLPSAPDSPTAESLLQSIRDHVASLPADVPREGVIVSSDNPMRRRVGFTCTSTGKEWWISLVQLREAPMGVAKLFSSPGDRVALARNLSSGT